MRGYNNELDHTADFDHYMYTRLLALGLIDSVLTLPVTVAELVVSRLRSGNNTPFWPGLRTVHATITDVNTVTTERWKAQGIWMVIELKFSQWSCPFCALVFFALFGLTERKRTQYRNLFWKIMKPLGMIPRADSTASGIWFVSRPAVSGAHIPPDTTV